MLCCEAMLDQVVRPEEFFLQNRRSRDATDPPHAPSERWKRDGASHKNIAMHYKCRNVSFVNERDGFCERPSTGKDGNCGQDR